MMKKITLSVVLIAVMAAPLRADLQYTMRFEIQKTNQPATTPLAMLVAPLAQQAFAKPVEVTYVAGEKGSRLTIAPGLPTLPNGAVVISQTGGGSYVLDPEQKTYWKVDVASAPAADGSETPPAMRKTGTMDTVNTYRAEQLLFEKKSDLSAIVPGLLANTNVPGGAQMASAIPTSFTWTIEEWVTDELTPPRGANDVIERVLLSAARVPVKLVIRANELSGIEVVMNIADVVKDASAPASLFALPSDFKELPPPT